MASRQAHWQLLLREYLERNPEEKKRIANALNVSVRTVDRWIAGTTDPSRPIVPRLATVIPGKETQMRLSLERDYPSAFERASEQEMMSNIPSVFYQIALDALSKIAKGVARGTIMNMVFDQMVRHLDPDEDGICALFAQCVKPKEGGKVTSLLVNTAGCGTGPWLYQQVQRSFYIGVGSLGAAAITLGRAALYPQDIVEVHLHLILHPEQIKSVVGFPVTRGGDFAGAVSLISTHSEFFTAARRTLIEQYISMFALALRDDEFYSLSQIEFRAIPSPDNQSEILEHVQEFVRSLKSPDETDEQAEARAMELIRGWGQWRQEQKEILCGQ